MAMPINMPPQMGETGAPQQMPPTTEQPKQLSAQSQPTVVSPGYQQYPGNPQEVMVNPQEGHAQGQPQVQGQMQSQISSQGQMQGQVNAPQQMGQNGYAGHHIQGQQPYAIMNPQAQASNTQAGQMGVAVPVQGMK